MTAYSGKTERDFIAGEDFPRLAAELKACLEHASPMKTGAVIDVYRATWRGRDVVIKWYKHVSLIHSFRYTLKGSRASRAWTNGQRLRALGIRTPRPLAYLDERRGPLLWQSWVVTEYVSSPTLYGVLRDGSVPEGRKRRIIHQALKLMDRLGSHGINHGDMKHTNILCNAGAIVLTDLDGMETHSLAWLHRQRRGRDIARFLRSIAVWQKKCELGSAIPTSEFETLELSSPAGKLWVNPTFRSQELEEALAVGPQAVVERFQAQPAQSGSASRVCRFTAAFSNAPVGVYLKEYLDRSVLDRLKHLARPSRAIRTLRASQMLSRHGFHVPEIIALGNLNSRRSSSSPQTSNLKLQTPHSFLATREITGAIPVYKYFVPDPALPVACSLRDKRRLLRELGLTVGAMHGEGILHGDLRPANILARTTDGGWEFFLLDNERTRQPLHLLDRLRLKNLVQINMLPACVSNTDRLRFFQSYLWMNPQVRLHYRQWTARITRLTRDRFRRKGWLITSSLAPI